MINMAFTVCERRMIYSEHGNEIIEKIKPRLHYGFKGRNQKEWMVNLSTRNIKILKDQSTM